MAIRSMINTGMDGGVIGWVKVVAILVILLVVLMLIVMVLTFLQFRYVERKVTY